MGCCVGYCYFNFRLYESYRHARGVGKVACSACARITPETHADYLRHQSLFPPDRGEEIPEGIPHPTPLHYFIKMVSNIRTANC
jgi:hypothetical protein